MGLPEGRVCGAFGNTVRRTLAGAGQPGGAVLHVLRQKPGQAAPDYRIDESTAAPYCDQPGGGVQYRIVRVVGGVDTDGSVQALLDVGLLGIPGVS